MEKDLSVLQKEINLHVNDIERMQGHIGRLFVIKGNQADELRRLKDKSRKTQQFLGESKKVQPSTMKTENTSMSPKRSMTATAMSGGGMGTSSSFSQNSLIVELILFGPSALAKKGQINMTTSSFA